MTISKANMFEATRLTREGRLAEAMAILRGALSAAAESANPYDSNLLEADARRSTFVDMEFPFQRTGGARIPRPGNDAFTAYGDLKRPSLKGLGVVLDRMPDLGAAIGVEGLLGRRMPPAIRLPPGATFDKCSFANQAGSRTYKLYVPSKYRGEPLPLLIMLHGCTQSPDDFATGTRMNEVAEEQTFLVAYPAQSQSANPSKCWNWFDAGEQRRDHGEPSLIAGITRQIIRDFPIETGRVYVAGLSAGGAAAAIMGATYPDLYAAIGVHSGLPCGAALDMPSAFAAMRQGGKPRAAKSRRLDQDMVPMIVFHGDSDKTVNPINGEQIIAQAQAEMTLSKATRRGRVPGGIAYTCTIQTDDTGRPLLEHWVLHGAGHAWSGGSASGSYTEPRGPDASREMVRFFLQQSAHRGLDQ